MPSELAEQIERVREATQRLLAGLDALTDADVARPSLCPGWTAGHVLTHIARNADGLCRTLEGARRGEPVPMYDSTQARNADIEAGATRTAAELTADVARGAQALDDAWAGLDAAAWDRDMLHRRLGKRPVGDTPAMRWYEIEIHHVDLAGSYGPGDWPAPFVADVLSESAGTLQARLPAGTAVDLEATDTAARWSFGPDGGRGITVSGPSWAIAAWLLGRTSPAADLLSATGGELPPLASWG